MVASAGAANAARGRHQWRWPGVQGGIFAPSAGKPSGRLPIVAELPLPFPMPGCLPFCSTSRHDCLKAVHTLNLGGCSQLLCMTCPVCWNCWQFAGPSTPSLRAAVQLVLFSFCYTCFRQVEEAPHHLFFHGGVGMFQRQLCKSAAPQHTKMFCPQHRGAQGPAIQSSHV